MNCLNSSWTSSLATLVAIGACMPGAWAYSTFPQEIASHPRELSTPPLRPFVPPQPLRLELEGGAELLVIELRELPLVDGTLIFKTSPSALTQQHAGISAMLADVLREGGSKRTSGTELDDWLDNHAASISVHSSTDSFRIDFSCIKADLGSVLIFVGELLSIPAYPEDEIEKSRARVLAQLARDAEDPGQLADQLLDSISLGSDSHLVRRASAEGVSAITREKLLALHGQTIGTDRLLVGATGSVNANSLAARLDTLFSKLPQLGNPPPPAPEVFRLPGRTRIYLHDVPGAAHCEIRIAGPGIRRLDVDYVPLYLWSYAMGYGGSSNRMMVRLRTELGLIYGGSLYYQPGWNRNGRFLVSCSSRTQDVKACLAALYELLNSARGTLNTEELDEVRNRVLNAEVFGIDSPEEVLKRSLDLELHGYPSDFWRKRDERIRALKSEEVSGAVTRHLDIDRMLIVVVGPAEQLQEPLAALGEVILLPTKD
ncbi:MAG: zinc protease [Candidatus Paceibacteria bacterium]